MLLGSVRAGLWYTSCAAEHSSSQGPHRAPFVVFACSKISVSLTQSNLLISVSHPDMAGQILPSGILHLIKSRVCKALPGLGTISDSDQFNRQWIYPVQKQLLLLWLIPEMKIWCLLSIFGFSLNICPVTQMLLLQTVSLENYLQDINRTELFLHFLASSWVINAARRAFCRKLCPSIQEVQVYVQMKNILANIPYLGCFVSHPPCSPPVWEEDLVQLLQEVSLE